MEPILNEIRNYGWQVCMNLVMQLGIARGVYYGESSRCLIEANTAIGCGDSH